MVQWVTGENTDNMQRWAPQNHLNLKQVVLAKPPHFDQWIGMVTQPLAYVVYKVTKDFAFSETLK